MRPRAATALAIAGATGLVVVLGFFFHAAWAMADERAAWKDQRDACPDQACRDALPPAPSLPFREYAALVAGVVGCLVPLIAGLAARPRQTPQDRPQRPRPDEDPAKARALLRAIAIALLVCGVGARIASPWFMDVGSDGGSYAAIGHAISKTGTMTLPWGDVWSSSSTPEPSHHYPPLYPLWLAGTYSLIGFGQWQTQLAAVLMSCLSLAILYSCSRNLLGHTPALVVTALVSVQSRLVWATGAGFSENLTVALFTVTMWGILRSIDWWTSTTTGPPGRTGTAHRIMAGKPWMVVVAGIGAGLTYLARSTMGAFFLVAGAGGFAWRVWFMRWRIFRNAPYLVAMLVFAAIAGAWVARNELLFGTWQGSGYNALAQSFAFTHPALLLQGIAYKAALFAGFLALYAGAFWLELRRALKNWSTETNSCLLLGVALTFLIGCILAAIYWTWENYPIWWMDNERYAVIGLVPLLWLIFQHAKATMSLVKRVAAAGLVFLCITAYVVGQTGAFPDSEAAAKLSVHAGDAIGYEGKTSKYGFYTALATQDVTVYPCHANATDSCPGHAPRFILSTYPVRDHPRYQLTDSLTMHGTTVMTWTRVTGGIP